MKIRPGDSDKKRRLAGILCVLGFIGVAGIHRFYVGKSLTGLLMLLTLGGLFIWTTLDLITILTGTFTDGLKLPLEKRKNDLWTILASAAFTILALVFIISLGGDQETDSASHVPVPTARPAIISESIPDVTAVQLFRERKANATRFDQTYKGRRVNIEGTVGQIEDGDVRLVTDEESFEALGRLFLEYVALQDLPTQAQVGANVGESFRATCTVGNYVLGTMYLKECEPR